MAVPGAQMMRDQQRPGRRDSETEPPPRSAESCIGVPGDALVGAVGGHHADHYSDRISADRIPDAPDRRGLDGPGPFEFDPYAFASLLVLHRRRHQWSTRELARRAGISQPYVVALERAVTDPRRPGPTPTIDVTAGLAHALGLEPTALFAGALRRVGRHVLLITDGGADRVLRHVRRAAASPVDTWAVARSRPAISAGAGASAPAREPLSIDLRRGAGGRYRPEAIAAALGAELARLADDVAGRQIGLVFAETSEVMLGLDDPATILDFEHRWADVVGTAARSAGAHAAYNVCVYDRAALATLADPVAATIDLLHSHDEVWSTRHGRVTSGATAARQVLGRLRPAHHDASAWRHAVDGIIHDLGLTA